MSTTGQNLTRTLRQLHHIGTRTRSSRVSHLTIVLDVRTSVTNPDAFDTTTADTLQVGWASVNGYTKHIIGRRVGWRVCKHVNNMTPWQFTALLGDMVDAGVTNTYEAHEFFMQMESNR